MAKLDLKTIPTYAKVIILVAIFLIPAVSFYFLVYSPKSKEIKRLDAEITKLDNEIATAKVKVRRLAELKIENEKLREQLAELREQLPEEQEVSVLLKQVSDLGLTSGLTILLWKPAGRRPDPEGIYVEIPVEVQVMGGYHDLGVFYSYISQLKRIVNISNITISPPTQRALEGKYLLPASFTASTFSAVQEPAEGAAGEGGS